MMHKSAFGAVGLLILVAVPVVGKAQQRIMISGGQGMMIMSATDAPDAAKPSAGISADSLTKINKFVKDSLPLLFIDEKIAQPKAMTALKAEQIASVQYKEASDGDIKYYGAKAKHGIMTITTRTVAKDQDQKPKSKKGQVMIMNGGQGTFTISPAP